MEWLIGAALLIPMGLAARHWSRDARLKRALRRAQPATIAEFPERGAARITGRIRLVEEPLVAPLSRRPCAYFEVVFRSPSPNPPRREAERRDFVIEDDTGAALVRIAGARVAVVMDGHRRAVAVEGEAVTESDFESDADLRRVIADIHRLGAEGAARAHDLPVELVRRWLRETLRTDYIVEEGVLEEGEEIAVFGRGSRELDPDPAATANPYRERATRLVLRALLVTDDPSAWRRDGR